MLGAKKPTHKIAVFNKNEEEFVFLGLKLYLMLSLARTKTWVCDLVKGQGGGFTHLKPGSTFVEIFHQFWAIVFVHLWSNVLWSQPKQKTAVFSLLYRCPSGHALRLLISVLTNHRASSVVITLGCLKSFKCSWKVEFRRWITGVKILAEYRKKFGSNTIWLPTKLFLLFARWPLLARKNLQRISLAKLVTKLRWVFTFLCLCLTY